MKEKELIAEFICSMKVSPHKWKATDHKVQFNNITLERSGRNFSWRLTAPFHQYFGWYNQRKISYAIAELKNAKISKELYTAEPPKTTKTKKTLLSCGSDIALSDAVSVEGNLAYPATAESKSLDGFASFDNKKNTPIHISSHGILRAKIVPCARESLHKDCKLFVSESMPGYLTPYTTSSGPVATLKDFSRYNGIDYVEVALI